MKKRYQAVSIEKRWRIATNEYFYVVKVHDTRGKDGIFNMWYENVPKSQVVRHLRAEDIEVSKHVENGGKLRLF